MSVLDLDLGLVQAVCREGMPAFLDQGVPTDFLQGAPLVAFNYVEACYLEYGKVPTIETVYRETGVNLNQAPVEPMKFWCDQIKERHLYNAMIEGLQKISTPLENRQATQAFQELENLVFSLRANTHFSANRPMPLFSDPEAMLRELERAKAGLTGVPTPFPSLNKITKGWQKGDLGLIAARPGLGKSLHPETPVLMFDGTVKQVQQVNPGELLMGPDSRPRTVLGVHRGREEMFEIIPVKGEKWVCNRSHILSLRMSSDNGNSYKKDQIINLSIDEYLAKNNKFKHHAKLWRTGVDFPKREVSFPAYLVGLWLGDGTKRETAISNSDMEIIEYLQNFSEEYQIKEMSSEGRSPQWYISHQGPGKRNHLHDYLQEFCVIDGQKRVPSIYKINDRNQRLELLAGLLDTDGSLVDEAGFEITTKYEGLKEDILFLARSLGFAAYAKESIKTIKKLGFEGVYWRISISGDCSLIPCKVKRKKAKVRQQIKNVLNTGFEIKSIGEGEYYGVELDGDHLYLLGDFTVTHNTWTLLILALWAWQSDCRVLLASTEMSHEALRRRALSLHEKISYGRIRDGKLYDEEEEHFKQAVFRHEGDENLLVLGDGFDMNLSVLEAAIIEKRPQAVFVDGMYLFKNKSAFKSKHENVGSVFDGFKAIAKRNQVPIIGTTQMNRPPKLGSVVQDLSRLAFTDNAGMVSDWVFYLKQTKELKDNRELEILPIKVRESDFTKNIRINWDFEEHDFSEKHVDLSKIEEEAASIMGADGNYIDTIPEEEQPF